MKETSRDQEMNPKHRSCLLIECCFWFYHALVLCLGLVILAKIIFTHDDTLSIMDSNQYKHSQQTVELWKKGYIVDIKAVNTNNCPQGYEPLLSYIWPGTETGCYCQANLGTGNSINVILTGTCTSELIYQGCQQVNTVQRQTLNMWKGQKLICQKRATSLNFYYSTSNFDSKGNAMTKCAFGKAYQVHTLGNVSCPVSQASNTSLSASAISILLDSKNNLYLNYISQTNYPIADFIIQQYNFCPFLNQINVSPNKVGNYKLLNDAYSTCSGTDSRVIQFDQLNQEDFYTNNTRVYDLINSLPGYPRPSVNYNLKLGYIKYPAWTYQCRILPTHNLNEATDHLLFKNQNDMIKTMVGISIPCILIFAILFRIIFITRHALQLKTRYTYKALLLSYQEIAEQLPNLNLKKSFVKELILFLIQIILRIAVIIVVILALLTMFDSSVWTKKMLTYKCTETYIQNIFKFYENQMDDMNNKLVDVCFIWVIMFAVDIIYFITRVKYGDLYEKQEQKIQEQYEIGNKQKDQIEEKQNFKAEDSSQILFVKDKELKINNIDDQDKLFGNGQTKQNFYNPLQNSDYAIVAAKKKKKKGSTKKRKNLFKDES